MRKVAVVGVGMTKFGRHEIKSQLELFGEAAMAAIKAHKNGAKNPRAHFQKEITREMVFNSAMIAATLQMYDCCPISDGGSAMVLTSLDIAKKVTVDCKEF